MQVSRLARVVVLGGLIASTLSFSVVAAPFQNLGFEQAFSGSPYFGIPPSGGSVPGAGALPHWTWSGIPGTKVDYELLLLDAPMVGLYHTNALGGAYTAALGDAIVVGSFGTPQNHNVTLSQIGTLPANARSVRFDVFMYFFTPGGVTPTEPLWINNTLGLSLGGTATPLIRTSLTGGLGMAGNPDPWTFEGEVGADVTNFAGQTVELKFLMLPFEFNGADSMLFIDDIYFSTIPIPEPSSFVLTILGLSGMVVCSRRRNRSA